MPIDIGRACHLLLAEPHASTIFVAEADGVVVGMVTAQIVISTSIGGYSILLEDMYVASGFRRKGVGSKLLEQVLVWGSEHDARRVSTRCRHSEHRGIQVLQASGPAGEPYDGTLRKIGCHQLEFSLIRMERALQERRFSYSIRLCGMVNSQPALA